MNKVYLGDCLDILKTLEDSSVDSIVTDPPYELGFMGKSWDNTGIANNPLMWAECLRVLKPGGYLLSFGGTRTYHRMASAIEDAGFEVRDMIEWVYSTGFPKSLNLNKALQKKCSCGNMVAYDNERTKQNTQHNLRHMSEPDLSQEITDTETKGEVLLNSVSEQSLSPKGVQLSHKIREGQSSLEGGSNTKETEGELQGGDLPEMSTGVSADGEEGLLHNATQTGDGSTLETNTNENGSGASHRPQSEQQQDREPCAFCKQWGTQETRRLYEATYGVGTALKPAHEPICLARKPLAEKTVAENVLKYGTGGINIDESRVEAPNEDTGRKNISDVKDTDTVGNWGMKAHDSSGRIGEGRFPANLIHDNSEEVRECFPESNSGKGKASTYEKFGGQWGKGTQIRNEDYGDKGNASRFFKSIPIEEQDEIQEECTDMEEKLEKLGLEQQDLQKNSDEYWNNQAISTKSIIYQAKASKSERNKGCGGLPLGEPPASARSKPAEGRENALGKPRANNHPTVKPIALMEYLIKMVTPKGGIVLDPFAGSGSTLVAAKQNGFNYIGIEMTAEYIPIIEARLNEKRD